MAAPIELPTLLHILLSNYTLANEGIYTIYLYIQCIYVCVSTAYVQHWKLLLRLIHTFICTYAVCSAPPTGSSVRCVCLLFITSNKLLFTLCLPIRLTVMYQRKHAYHTYICANQYMWHVCNHQCHLHNPLAAGWDAFPAMFLTFCGCIQLAGYLVA